MEEDKQFQELIRYFTRLNKKGKKAVIRKACALLDQQNKNAASVAPETASVRSEDQKTNKDSTP